MPEDHRARRDRLRAVFLAQDQDAALITELVNVRYLTGFTGSNAVLLVTAHRVVLGTDGRYRTQAATQAPDVELLIERATIGAMLAHAEMLGARTLGFEAHHVTVETHADLAAAHPTLRLHPLGHVVETLRTVKDIGELASLRQAAAIADNALAEVIEGLVLGRTERHVARELERRMLDKGAEAPAFETIVASGANSAIPHHRPTDRRISRGDLLKIDFGARVDGYHSDMTRTFVVGANPADWQVELYDLVFAAQRAGREALAPGVPVATVDGAARALIIEAGHGENFGHGLGHGVGLQIHEAPMLSRTSNATLAAGMPVTVEPGVYLEGIGGIRIEDTLVVGEAGPELLTLSTKELLVLD